jgi:hypothetical protein
VPKIALPVHTGRRPPQAGDLTTTVRTSIADVSSDSSQHPVRALTAYFFTSGAFLTLFASPDAKHTNIAGDLWHQP